MDKQKLKIIFIGGAGRSGSTLLDCMLGQQEGVFSLGEIHHIWQRSFCENQLCGCGQPFQACAFWQSVIEEAFKQTTHFDPKAIAELQLKVARFRYLLPLSAPALRSKQFQADLQAYTAILDQLYQAIHVVSGCSILVDSSKEPAHGFILTELANIDLRIIHLLRDSRAVAYSWQRTKRRPEIYWKDTLMPQYGVLFSTYQWFSYNSGMSLLCTTSDKAAVIRYEDLVSKPQQVLTELEEAFALGLQTTGVGQTFAVKPNHTVAGNPMRFAKGDIRLNLDAEWQQKMAWWPFCVVSTLTSPLLLKYGYFQQNSGQKA